MPPLCFEVRLTTNKQSIANPWKKPIRCNEILYCTVSSESFNDNISSFSLWKNECEGCRFMIWVTGWHLAMLMINCKGTEHLLLFMLHVESLQGASERIDDKKKDGISDPCVQVSWHCMHLPKNDHCIKMILYW